LGRIDRITGQLSRGFPKIAICISGSPTHRVRVFRKEAIPSVDLHARNYELNKIDNLVVGARHLGETSGMVAELPVKCHTLTKF
jgi:hypothetical protein